MTKEDAIKILNYGYGLEERSDWEDVIAWMPLPASYKKEDEA